MNKQKILGIEKRCLHFFNVLSMFKQFNTIKTFLKSQTKLKVSKWKQWIIFNWANVGKNSQSLPKQNVVHQCLRKNIKTVKDQIKQNAEWRVSKMVEKHRIEHKKTEGLHQTAPNCKSGERRTAFWTKKQFNKRPGK